MSIVDLKAKTANAVPAVELTQSEITDFLTMMPEWTLDDDGRLITNLELDNFVSVLSLVNDIGVIAEEEGHHPDMLIYEYIKLGISLVTDEAGGSLTERDFIVAAKIDELLENGAQAED